MRRVLVFLFGRHAEDIVAVNIGGVDWYSAQQVCEFLAIKDVSSAMGQRQSLLELVEGEDKCKIRVPEISRHSDVWLISVSGIWKLMLCSQSVRADRFRAWLATRCLPRVIGDCVQDPGVAEVGYRGFL
jgi:Prophage antirepressor